MSRNIPDNHFQGGQNVATPGPAEPARSLAHLIHPPVTSWVVPGGGGTLQPTNRNGGVISADATAHAGTVQLPAAAGRDGLTFTVKNRKGGNTVTVTPTGTDLIDDHLSVPLANRGDTATFQAVDNTVETGWLVISCCVDIS